MASRLLGALKKKNPRKGEAEIKITSWYGQSSTTNHKIECQNKLRKTENAASVEWRRTNLPYDVSFLELEDKKYKFSQYQKALR
jgi:hypothetical protein